MEMTKQNSFKKIWSLVLTIAMVMSIFQGLAFPVSAEELEPDPDTSLINQLNGVDPVNNEITPNNEETDGGDGEGGEAGAEAIAPASITVTPATATVDLGKTQQFTASFIGEEGMSTEIIWIVEGNTESATTVTAAGLLTVSGVEGADKLTVKAVSTANEEVFGSAVVTVADLAFSTALSKNDLDLHYIFDQNEKGPDNNIVKDYSPKGNDSYIRGTTNSSQWNANGFQFLSANSNYIVVSGYTRVPQNLTFIFGASKTTASAGTGNGVMFCGRTGWSSNGFWINNSQQIFHSGTSNPGYFCSTNGWTNAFSSANVVEEYAYAVNGSSVSNSFILRNGTTAPGARTSTDAHAAQSIPNGLFIGANYWGPDEYLNNIRLNKYMVFNRVLTQAECVEVYNGRLDPYKSGLNDAVVAGKARNKDLYTVESMAAFRSTLRAAVNVLENRSATQAQVDDALASLKAGIRELRLADESAITGVEVSPATIRLNPATSHKFSAAVTGTISNKTVEWEVSGNESEDTVIAQDGTLSIAIDESAETLTVTAYSTVDYSHFGEAEVTVADDPFVISVTVSPKTVDIVKGVETVDFTAEVAVLNDADKKVNWTVNSTNPGTSITADGKLSVAADEALNTLTVTAASDFNSAKSDTATVNAYTISTVTIHAPSGNPQKNRTTLYSTTVAGTGTLPLAAQDVIWSIESAHHANTTINNTGNLYISPDETAETLTLKVTSAKDASKSSELIVTVDEFQEEVLKPQNLYFNTIARNPETGATISAGTNMTAFSEFKSAGTWNTVSATINNPRSTSTNTWTGNWATLVNRYTNPNPSEMYAGGYLYGDCLYIGTYNMGLRYGSGTAPGSEFAIYEKAKFADVDFTAGMIVPASGTGAVVFRYQDPQNYYYLKVSAGSANGNIVLGKVVNGQNNVLRTATQSTTAGTWYSWRIQVRGNNITVKRNTYPNWKPSDYSSTRVVTPFNNVVLDSSPQFTQGYCGLWAVDKNTNVNFSLIGIVSLDFNYTLENDTFKMTSGSQGQLKSVNVKGANGTYPSFTSSSAAPLEIMGSENTNNLEIGMNKYLGELRFRYRVGTGNTDRFASTGRSDDIREMSFDEANNKINVNYNGVSANATNGIRDFAVNESYAVGTDENGRDYIQLDINVKNTSGSSITLRDIGMPISWNGHWEFDAAYTDYVSTSNHVAYHGSYIVAEVGGGGKNKVVFIPDNSTDAKLEYRRYVSSGDYFANLPEEFYIYSDGISKDTGGTGASNAFQKNFDQSYLPNTSATMADGEEKTFGFRIYNIEDYLDLNNLLGEQTISTIAKPGMVMPIDNIAEVEVRTKYKITGVDVVTPSPANASGIQVQGEHKPIFELKSKDGDSSIYTIEFKKLGRNDVRFIYETEDGGQRWTVMQFWIQEPLKDAIQRRADFLVDYCFVSDDMYTKVMAAAAGSGSGQVASATKTYVQNHKYSFLEVDNRTGLVKPNGGNSDYCNDNNHEQYNDGAAFLASKNVSYPVKRELKALEQYLIDLCYEKEVRKFGTTQSTGNGSSGHEGTIWHGCCNTGYWPDATGVGSAGASLSTRTFNYINMSATFWGMYEATKAHPEVLGAEARWQPVDYLKVAAILAYRGTSRSGSTGQMNDFGVGQIYARLLEEAAAGNEGTIADPSGTGGRTYRSCSNLASLLYTVSNTKGQNMTNRDFPFGSEFAFDNTGEEGAYFFARDFATRTNRYDKMSQTVNKTIAWLGKVPEWWLQSTGRPMGADWWLFQYSTGHQSKILDDWYFNYADTRDAAAQSYSGSEYSQGMWRYIYPMKMASFVYIQSGQPEVYGPSSKNAGLLGVPANPNQSTQGRGILGSNWGNYMPSKPYNWNLAFPYGESAESDYGTWGGLNSLSADVVPNDPSFGLAGWGCEVTEEDGSYVVKPMDGLSRRLNIVGDKFQMELYSDRYTRAIVDKEYNGLTLMMESGMQEAKAHTGTISLNGLTPGKYNVRVNGVLQRSVTVSTTVNSQTGLVNPVKVTYDAGADENFTVSIVDAATDTITGISLDKNELLLVVGTSDSLTATVTPNSASNKAVIWTSSDDKVATVDNEGNVTAVSSGSVTITAATAEGGFSATCEVTAYIPVDSIKIDGAAIQQVRMRNTKQFTATINPTDATDKTVIWESGNTKFFTVDKNGLVTGLATGSAKLIATTPNGKTSFIMVQVTA